MPYLTKSINVVIREEFPVPEYIHACAAACRYDLLHGPSWSLVPAAGIEHFTLDSFATYHEDLVEIAEDGDSVVETYTSIVGDTLRDFIAGLPSECYVDEDNCYLGTREPEGEYLETGEYDEDGNPITEWCEPAPYYHVGNRDIVEALFGRTIAREFS